MMKHGGYKSLDFAGCEKSPVVAFIPVCFAIDINFV